MIGTNRHRLPHNCPMAKLTDCVVSSLKPQRQQVGWREVADGSCRGLCLRLSPRGEKVWAIRHTVAGRRTRHTIGAYPAISLAEARRRAGEYLSAARDGLSADMVDTKAHALNMTVTEAHGEYLASVGATVRTTTKKLKKGMLIDHIEPVIGGRLIRLIRRHDILEVVEAVTRKGHPVQANRVFSEIMALLRWCEQKGYVPGVPSIRKRDLRGFGAAKEQSRRRTLTNAEIREIWNGSAELGELTRDFLRLLLLTGQRRDEVRLMTWQEIDLDQALWTIPAARYKSGIDHVVPLSEPVLDILRGRRTAGTVAYVLPGRVNGKMFNGAASALRRLQAAMFNRPPFTLHDLRRTVRTGLSRLGIDDETAEMVIGHRPQGMAKVYNLHDRLDERRDALGRWAHFVLSLSEQTMDNLVRLATRS